MNPRELDDAIRDAERGVKLSSLSGDVALGILLGSGVALIFAAFIGCRMDNGPVVPLLMALVGTGGFGTLLAGAMDSSARDRVATLQAQRQWLLKHRAPEDRHG